MCNETITFTATGVILAVTKDDVLPDSVRTGVHISGGLGCFGVRVDAYIAEITPKARLHEGAGAAIQRLAGPIDGLVYGRGCSHTCDPTAGRLGLHLFFLVYHLGALQAERLRHDLGRDAIRLLFMHIARLIDRQLALKRNRLANHRTRPAGCA
ncbi:MAG: hypothetical protein OHK0046_41740 [Anaerolineae bacterium]